MTAAAQVAAADQPPLLHAVFQDHIVLQRDKPIRIWGQAAPGGKVTASIAGATAQTRADETGRWTLNLPAMSAGGPHELSVTTDSGATQTVNDVLIGDVWLCSGQSNMVLQVHRALDSRAEIAESQNDRIRTLTVRQASSAIPLNAFADPVEWRKAAPDTARDFSAVCLFYARELQKAVDVPMGLIAAAWGGSRIQTWMSAQALRASGEYDEALDVLGLYSRDPAAAYARWGGMWESWWLKRMRALGRSDMLRPWSAGAQGEWRKAPRELGHWEEWGPPDLQKYDGMLWYRTSVRLSAKQAAQPAMLSLGLVDEMDQTWINGRPIGTGAGRGAPGRETGKTLGADEDANEGATLDAGEQSAPFTGPGPQRTYRLVPGELRAGENVIVVNVLDTYGLGGLHGLAEDRALLFVDGERVALDGEWLWRQPPAETGAPPRSPWTAVAGAGVIYNAMIAPLGDFGLRGVLWYQGESNTDDAGRYQDLLTRFMADWRGKFGADLPFLIVQLANYGPPPTAPVESGWAELREAQRLAVAQDAHAGLAIAIDIGDRYDIHPANKQEVGRRLARAARHVIYGESIPPSGPIPLKTHREGESVVVAFGDVTGRLITYSADDPIGFELCAAARNSCRYVKAEIDNHSVRLDAGDFAAATRVRYCWADSPVCTLYDEARLPAGPFEIEVQ